MITAVVSLGLLGLLFGGGLALASRILAVEVDERETKVLEVLPGANCGACGYPGCAGFATALVKGEVEARECPVGGASLPQKVANVLGGEVGEAGQRQVAVVQCKGGIDVAGIMFTYHGIKTCKASQVSGGHKGCPYGCLRMGDCVAVCPFGAMEMGEDGLPRIDKEKCTACGKCVLECPRDIIQLIPESQNTVVRCNSVDRGPEVRKYCKVGCIACRICARNCPEEAFIIENNLARIIADKCTNCGICVEKCPMKTIDDMAG